MRKIVEETAADYPEVELEHMLVDNCAMQLVKDRVSLTLFLQRICLEIFCQMKQAWLQGQSECLLPQSE